MIKIIRGIVMDYEQTINFLEIEKQCEYNLSYAPYNGGYLMGVLLFNGNADTPIRYREIEQDVNIELTLYLYNFFKSNNIEFQRIGTWILES